MTQFLYTSSNVFGNRIPDSPIKNTRKNLLCVTCIRSHIFFGLVVEARDLDSVVCILSIDCLARSSMINFIIFTPS